MKALNLVLFLILSTLYVSLSAQNPVFNDAIRPAAPETYSMTIVNKSMWDVAFRVQTHSGWSEWKYARIDVNSKPVFLSADGPIQNYEVQWKDLNKWKGFSATPVIPFDKNNIKYTVTGNTFKKISID